MTQCGKLAAELLLLLLLADGWRPASGKRASPVRDRRRGTKSAPMSATKSLTGSLKLVTSKKQAALPEPLPEFRFDPDGVWRRTAGKSGHVLRVEHSPTSRARCRRCGTAVAKGELRIGFPMHDSRGEDGAVTGVFLASVVTCFCVFYLRLSLRADVCAAALAPLPLSHAQAGIT